MPDLIHHIASFARFSTNRGERERNDADAMRELASRPLELARAVATLPPMEAVQMPLDTRRRRA